jgi:hypothetical protein
VTGEDLAMVVGERYFEVYNGHPLVNHMGDATHPGDERIWDIANTIRLAQVHAAPLMGLGSDDTHHYHVGGMSRSTAGRGWVMVQAEALTADAITRALKAGDFYASSGVTLRELKYDSATRTISLAINPDGDATFTTQFVGTPREFSTGGKTPIDSSDVGKVFASVTGLTPSYTLGGNELYVRAMVTSSKPHPNPSMPDQKQQAWAQPVGWEESEAVRR